TARGGCDRIENIAQSGLGAQKEPQQAVFVSAFGEPPGQIDVQDDVFRERSEARLHPRGQQHYADDEQHGEKTDGSKKTDYDTAHAVRLFRSALDGAANDRRARTPPSAPPPGARG